MKEINLKLNDEIVDELKKIANTYHQNISDLVKDGIKKIITERKNDLYYRMKNLSSCSESEEREIMDELAKISEEDFQIGEVEVVDFR
ncbi:MAG: hypothetical protein ACRCSK_01460 [Fusobacteriaceae bacterium]